MNELSKIRGLLLDLEGVLYIGEKLIDGSLEATKRMCKRRHKVHNI